jgi:hypothetical protein
MSDEKPQTTEAPEADAPEAAAPESAPPAAPAAEAPAEASGQTEPEVPTEEEFDARIQAANDGLMAAKQAVKDAEANIRVAEKAVDSAVRAKLAVYPAPTPATSIQAHLAREQQRRESRVAAATAANDAMGGKVASGKSPLDASIGNRRKPQPLIPAPAPKT